LQRELLRYGLLRLYIWIEEEKLAKQRGKICLAKVALGRFDQGIVGDREGISPGWTY
jgi:hypothetical protein